MVCYKVSSWCKPLRVWPWIDKRGLTWFWLTINWFSNKMVYALVSTSEGFFSGNGLNSYKSITRPERRMISLHLFINFLPLLVLKKIMILT